jgi:hypothetical protein
MADFQIKSKNIRFIDDTIQKMILFYNYNIKNKLNNKEVLKNIYSKLSKIQKKILNNIIILDLIKESIIKKNNIDYPINTLLSIKFKEIYPKSLFYFLYKDIYTLKIKKLLKKEIFLRKSPEEQKIIKDQLLIKKKERNNNMTNEEKKIRNLKKKKNLIKKYGLESYREKLRSQYKKWYTNLSSEKKEKIIIKRKLRYKYLSVDIKNKYKNNKNTKYYSLSLEERKKLNLQYKKNREKKINAMNSEQKQIYITNLRKRKLKYFQNLSESKKKYYYKIRTFQRQLKKKQISLDEYNKKKKLTASYFTK